MKRGLKVVVDAARPGTAEGCRVFPDEEGTERKVLAHSSLIGPALQSIPR